MGLTPEQQEQIRQHEEEMRQKYPVNPEMPFNPLVLEALKEHSSINSDYSCTCVTDPSTCPFHILVEEPLKPKDDKLARIPQTAESLSARVDRNLDIQVSPELGEQLTQAALARIRGRHSDQLIQFVAATMDNIRTFKHNIEDNKRYLAFQERRLAAINAGEFTLDRNLLPVFNDETLNG